MSTLWGINIFLISQNDHTNIKQTRPLEYQAIISGIGQTFTGIEPELHTRGMLLTQSDPSPNVKITLPMLSRLK